MAKNQTRVSGATLFTSLVLAGFILLLMPSNITNRFHFAFVRMFGPILNIGRSVPVNKISNVVDLSGFVNRQEHNLLQNAYANLYADLLEEHNRLKELAGLRKISLPQSGAGLILADVISVSLGLRHKISINLGTDDGLIPGQYVLGDNSIIGIISNMISTHNAEVRLTTDTSHKMLVEIAAPKENAFIRGIMQGNGTNSGSISMISREYKIGKHDAVYAAKKPGFLDTPRIIGKVGSCRPDDKNPLLWDIIVEPVCNFENLKRVAVIVMNTPKTD